MYEFNTSTFKGKFLTTDEFLLLPQYDNCPSLIKIDLKTMQNQTLTY